MSRLNAGDPFPEMSVTTVEGRPLAVPRDLEGDYAILTFYRGWWCPFCRRQLAGYRDEHDERFAEEALG